MPSGPNRETRLSLRDVARPAILTAALGALGLAVAAIVAFALIDTASGRISGSTETAASVFAAGEVNVDVDTPQGLLFDVDGLYPGLVVERCLVVRYTGSIDDVDLRLTADRRSPDAGLERFVETTIELGSGVDPECTDHLPTGVIFAGLLDGLWTRHPDYENGLSVAAVAGDGFATTVRVTATVVDDNRAQGLSTDFWIELEARP